MARSSTARSAKSDTVKLGFYSPEWQAKEAEADADIAAGRVIGPFKDAKSLRKAIKAAKV